MTRLTTRFGLIAFILVTVLGMIGLWLLKATDKGWHISGESSRVHLSVQPSPAQAAGVNISVDQVVVSGLDHPVYLTHAGDGSDRLFVVEQVGKVRIIQNGTLLSTPFLNITNKVLYGGERGLLSVAFAPDFETSGVFYVDYTRQPDGYTIVARYTASGNVADPNSEEILLTVPQPYANHNGGLLLFGPNDGYLYIGMGDGGSAGDPQNNAQNTQSLLGKLLRIHVSSAVSPYTIPPDNPYANSSAGRGEIWDIGLRNPWRYSFDRANGDLYIADVGQSSWEEVDFQAAGTGAGLNFGWNCKEGTHDYNFTGACASLNLTDPITEYSHSDGKAITGGYVYRGSLYPALEGRYFFADYAYGKIWSMAKTGTNPITWSAPTLELSPGFPISSFGEDEAGELYVVDYGGSIRRLVDANGPSPNVRSSVKYPSTPHADTGQVVTYTIQINNTGAASAQTANLTDSIPSGLAYQNGSAAASTGSVTAQNGIITWQGALDQPVITITYRVSVTSQDTGSLINRATLDGPDFAPLEMASALFVPNPTLYTTNADSFLPGTQPGTLNQAVEIATGCDFCHTAPIYDRWRGSPMSQAGRDPLMWAALSVSNNVLPNSGDYCLRCHTSQGWLENRSHPADGSALVPTDVNDGVSCDLCHRMVDPIPSTSDEARAIDADIRAALTTTVPISNIGSGMMIVDPHDNRRGPFAIAPPPPHTAYKTDYMGQDGDAVTESRLCSTCHNLDNPFFSWDAGRNQYWPNASGAPAPAYGKDEMLPIERTYDEWLNSDFAQAGGVYAPGFAGAKPDGMVSTCQDCHLKRTTGVAAEGTYSATERDCQTTGCLPGHNFVGGNNWLPQLVQDDRWRLAASGGQDPHLDAAITDAQSMLRQAAAISVTFAADGGGKQALVRVTNRAGHKLPTGYPEGRRVWVNLQAYDDADQLVFESGAYDAGTDTLVEDGQIKIYEIKPGFTNELAQLLDLPDVPTGGTTFYFLMNNSVIKDNRIPPQGYTQAAFDKPGMRPVGASYADGQNWDETTYTLPNNAVRVVARLYYQLASKEYVDFLRSRGGLDGSVLGELWDDLKSTPLLMGRDCDPGNCTTYYFPLITKTTLQT